MDSDEKNVMLAVARHLHEKASKSSNAGKTAESLTLAIQSICDVYAIDITEVRTSGTGNISFVDVYLAGSERLGISRGSCDVGPASAHHSATAGSSKSKSADVAFQKFLARLKSTTKFFEGVEEGSVAYEQRVTKAREKFEARLASKQQGGGGEPIPLGGGSGAAGASDASEDSSVPVDARAPMDGAAGVGKDEGEWSRKERLERAERLKEEGNVHLKGQRYEEALRLYSEAIALNEEKAAYYSNRAAALLHLGRYSEAVSDCEQALGLDSKFLRARERLATAYRRLGMFDLEHETLVTALQLHPTEVRLQEEVKASAERKRVGMDLERRQPMEGVMDANAGAGAGGGAGGMDDQLGSLLGGGMNGTGPGMAGLMSMASRLASNPGVARMMEEAMAGGGGGSASPAAMMQGLMQNPEMMQTMMQTFGSMFGGGGAPTGTNGERRTQ